MLERHMHTLQAHGWRLRDRGRGFVRGTGKRKEILYPVARGICLLSGSDAPRRVGKTLAEAVEAMYPREAHGMVWLPNEPQFVTRRAEIDGEPVFLVEAVR